ncbi:hypothetical protein PHYPO_G00203330 [Pangasianodon hypophthalmus]|uniref:ATP synthase peripheral stalk subunit OSCP, mitochondrial n=1 Tax=Pangasianodon hypophthalmus TaxID=310915 RepID=A0A5N5PCD4_PANHP|nr:hypothetical protein PHYPO_G00203330 [Pangasianodon hypophthalmus]
MAALGLGLQVRQLSTSVVRPAAKLIKPPIQVYGVEGRYATALYSAASKQKSLEKVEQELGRVASLIKDPKLSSIVLNPHIKRSIKQKTVSDALNKAKLSPITVNLINVLADNGLTTAQPLDEANLAELKVALNGFLAKGETIKLETKCDPSILGGMIVSIGDKYVDMSTKSKIQKLTKLIRET